MRYLYLLLVIFFHSCSVSQQLKPEKSTKSKQKVTIQEESTKNTRNIIFLIGDGYGLSQATAGMISNSNKLQIERCPVVGIHKPFTMDNLIIDSAAGATAFSIGKKTKNGYLGIDSTGRTYQTIMEEAEKKGFATGLIVTSTIVHATPAAYFSHQNNRDNYEAIALDLLDSDFNLLIGGGKKYFDRRSTDTLNLIAALKDKGYHLSDYFEQDYQQWALPKTNKLAFFTADGDPLPVASGRNYLPKATKDGIQFLKEIKSKGFFLLIEGSQIDWGGHANDGNYIISEVLDFDKAIEEALNFAQKDGNTLVVITADHETGGFSINGRSKSGELSTAFTSKKHTADLIPVYAFGPGAEMFSGIYENTEIYYKMRKLLFD